MPALQEPDLALRWRRCVNTSPDALEAWLTTPESASVGTRSPGDPWSVGQLAGRRTLELLEMPAEEWRESEWAHVRRLSSFVRRHRAQWPSGDLTGRRWRHSLRNWGHDPLWEGRLAAPDPASETQSLLVDGEEVGRLCLDGDETEVLVTDLVLDPQWRGRGIGSAVLHALARDHGPRLSVHLGHDRSVRAFFLRRGFHSPDDGERLVHRR